MNQLNNDDNARPFEVLLVDAVGDTRQLGGTHLRVVLSQLTSGHTAILSHSGYWQGCVDVLVRQLLAVRKVDRRCCAVISAYSSHHIQQVVQYLQRVYPCIYSASLGCMDYGDMAGVQYSGALAVDVIVTGPTIPHGLDRMSITAVAILSDHQQVGFVRRLLNVSPDESSSRTTLYAIVPDYPDMAAAIDALRSPNDPNPKNLGTGILEPAEAEADDLTCVVAASVTGTRALGPDPSGDLTTSDCVKVEQIRREFGLEASPRTGLAAMLRANGVDLQSVFQEEFKAPQPQALPILQTTADRERQLRRGLQSIAVACDTAIREVDPGWQWGMTAMACKQAHNAKSVRACSLEELYVRLGWLLRWREAVNARVSECDGSRQLKSLA